MGAQYDKKTGSRGIEWTDETRNATGGCMHRCKWEMPDGTIVECYSMETAEHGIAVKGYPHGFEHHYWRESMLPQLTRGPDPKLIFCDSMSDLLARNVPREHVEQILGAMPKASHHTYQSLTKASPQLLKYTDLMPMNLWIGVSSPPDFFMGHRLTRDQQKSMLKRALSVLSEVKQRTGNIVWISAEPVSWDLREVMEADHPLDWIVIGAASHKKRDFQPDPVHIQSLLELMDATETPVFFKGNIRALFDSHDFGTSELHRWREDFPAAYHDGSSIPAVDARQIQCEIHGWTKSVYSAEARV